MAARSQIRVGTERVIDAPAVVVYQCLADYRQHHPQFLPDAFSDFAVEQGGVGAGTVVRYTVTVGGRPRSYRDVISEPIPGRVLVETDEAAGKVTTFTVEANGDQSLVRIATVFPAAGGLAGLIERWLAPRMLAALYKDELDRLNQYAAGVAAGA
jgi:hypothetical protein